MEYYTEKRKSVICSRKKHNNCRNRGGFCGCECHLVDNSTVKTITAKENIDLLDIWLNKKWRDFWKPFIP